MFEITEPSLIEKFRFFCTSSLSKLGKRLGYSQTQLIVCGYPRGGTSLLYNMFSATLQNSFNFTEFEKYYIHFIHKMGNIASKAPMDILHLHAVDKLNIHNKSVIAIIVIRDIRDVITSMHPIKSNEYFIGYDNSWWPQNGGMDEWKYDAPGVVDITNEIRKVGQKKEVSIVRYEDLVVAPDRIQKDISKKYNLSFDGLFSQYHEFKGKLAYQYTGKYQAKDDSLVMEGKAVVDRSKRWKDPRYKERLIQQFTKCPELFEILIEFGYEDDNSWFEDFVANS